MKQNEPITIQLSYMDLQRLSGYTIPLRPCFVIFNRETKEIAKVVSASKVQACYKLNWSVSDCDIVQQPDSASSPGIVYCKPLRLRKDLPKVSK